MKKQEFKSIFFKNQKEVDEWIAYLEKKLASLQKERTQFAKQRMYACAELLDKPIDEIWLRINHFKSLDLKEFGVYGELVQKEPEFTKEEIENLFKGIHGAYEWTRMLNDELKTAREYKAIYKKDITKLDVLYTYGLSIMRCLQESLPTLYYQPCTGTVKVPKRDEP